MADGDTVALGAVRLTVLETPGHSPESISILVSDPDQDVDPFAVLTGDTLFIGDVGRPDLRGALGWSAEELGGMLYDSLHGKLACLPGDTLVYPAHGAGSLCGKNLSTDTVSTIGIQRDYNYALAPMSRERFIETVTADLPDAPAYFTYDAVLNAHERPTLEQALERELRPLTLEQTLDLQADGAQLLDTRDGAKFEAAHIKGSVNVGLGGSYATWCGTILDPERPIVLIAEPGREVEATTRLGRIAFDTVAGYLGGGMQSLTREPGVGRPHRADHTDHGGLSRRATGCACAPAPDRRARPGRMGCGADRGCGQRAAVAAARADRRASTRPPDRRPLRERIPVCDRRRPAPAQRASRTSPTSSAVWAAWTSAPQVEPADP